MITRRKALAAFAGGAAIVASPRRAFAAEFRIGLITPPSHEWSKTAVRIADELRERTSGRANLLVFPSGQLGNESQMLQQLQAGALDFAFLTLGEFANRDPNYGVFLAPYLVKNAAGARAVLKGRTAEELLGGMGRFGVQGLGYGMAGMRQIVMAGDVNTAADLSGKKIRTIPLAPELDFWRQLGAAPTPMPLPALYDAFANRQIDGMQIDFEGTWNSKYYLNAGTIVASNHMMFPMAAVASSRKLATMTSGDARLAVDLVKARLDELVAAYGRIDDEYLAQLRTTKVRILEADRAFFAAAVDRWYADWRGKASMLRQVEDEAARIG